MSVTITFQTVAEKLPSHNQEIIWLKGISSFGYVGFDPRHITVEYAWEDDEGTSYGYNYEDGVKGCRLKVLFDGYEVEPCDLWIDVEDYWKCFGN